MKIIKITLITLISLILLLIVGLVAAVHLIDINRHHDRIAQVVYDQTGRTLSIEGDFEWGLWPELYLKGGPLSLGNAPGFDREPFFHLESFHFSVTTWPLRRSEVHLQTLQVAGLQLNLERNQEGIGNWEDLAAEPDPAPAARPHKKKDPGAGLPFAALALGGIQIDRVNVNWYDQASGQQAHISDLRLTVGALQFGEPMQLELEFTAASNQPELEVAANAQATLLYDLNAGRYAIKPLQAAATFSGPTVPGEQTTMTLHTLLNLDTETSRAKLEDFRLQGLGTLVQAQLAMHDLEAGIPGCQGEVTVEVADLVELLEVFDSPLGRQLTAVQDRSINLATEFTVDPQQGRIMVPKLTAKLLGTTVRGRLEADNIYSDQPEVLGGIRAEGSDLPALLAIAARLQPGADQQALSRALAGLRDRGLLAEATFNSEGADIVVPHLHLRALATELTVNGRVSKLDAELPALDGQARLAGRDLPLLLKVASAFQGGPTAQTDDGPPPGAELWALADRIAAARRHSFNLSTGFSAEPDLQRLSIDNLSAAILGLEAQMDLAARNLLSEPDFKLALSLAPFNPRQLLPILEVELPDTADPRTLTSLQLKAEIDGTPERFTVKPLRLVLDDTSIGGEVTVHDLARQDLAFKIEVDAIDLDRYLPPESEEQPVTPETAAAGTALLPVELLRELLLEGELKVGELKVSGLRVSNFMMQARARDGEIRVAPLQAALYQGEMDSTINIDARGEQPQLQTTNRLRGVRIGPLLRDLTQEQEKIRGRADISYELTTRGNELDEFKANLNGKAELSFQDGEVVGINLGRLLRQTTALIERRTFAADEQAVTDFTTLSGSARITNGLVSNQDLRMMSPLLRVTGEGTANLVSEEIDYLLTAAVVATAEGQEGAELDALQGLVVPIRISGTFENPTFRPSLDGAAQAKLQENLRRLQDRLQQEGRRALEDLLGVPLDRPDRKDPEAPSPQQQLEEELEERLRDELRRRLRF
ncbi:AsmA family protein [Desulfurivibrio alkaliphilus]|uniref:AsmA family protein n=1 Tax=Desulfurivibrio alkaliphilus (strain DSM 19089 / UNIQEM U267 / AHT2) TaxID=589865 RepID=D6Z5A9_DESAT|nr:AsmA family protein [Desulfurivibrio alkaliphilus]ADH84766.1 AsmA family protein [Desulfurivibrio alkaliphilus AHT 2]